MTTKLGLVVIRAANVSRAARFYEALGFVFQSERHGTGPEHLAADLNGLVFEIYPLGKQPPTTRVRLGFQVDNVAVTIAALELAGGVIQSPPADGLWGLRAVLRDPEGHVIEIVQAT